MKRNYGLDLFRIFLCLCVVILHSLNYYGIENAYCTAIISGFLVQANGAFYLLSGYFNLEKEFNDSTDIKEYYKKKIIYVLFPFVAFLFVLTIWDYLHVNNGFNIIEILQNFYDTVMSSACDGHLWFLYPLFGLLLSTPFISKALHNMNEKELKILWYVAIGWNFVSYYLCWNLGVNFKFSSWFLDGWPIFYFAGYYYRHVIAKESKLKWIILGILGFVITNAGYLFYDSFTGAFDIQPMFTIFCVSCLMFWDKAFNISNEKIGKVILFISKNTFLIYLLHMHAIEYVVRKLDIVEASFINGSLVVVGSFILALIASMIVNTIMKPMQKGIDKVWIIKQ